MTIAEIDVSGYISVPEDCENGQTYQENVSISQQSGEMQNCYQVYIFINIHNIFQYLQLKDPVPVQQGALQTCVTNDGNEQHVPIQVSLQGDASQNSVPSAENTQQVSEQRGALQQISERGDDEPGTYVPTVPDNELTVQVPKVLDEKLTEYSTNDHWCLKFKRCNDCLEKHTPLKSEKFCRWAAKRKQIKKIFNENNKKMENTIVKLTKKNRELIIKRINELEAKLKPRLIEEQNKSMKNKTKSSTGKRPSIFKTVKYILMIILTMIMPTYQEETEEKTAITESEHITFWTFRLVCYFIIILCISFLMCFLHCFFVWNKNNKTYHDIERNINEDEAINLLPDKREVKIDEDDRKQMLAMNEVLDGKSCKLDFEYFDPKIIDENFVETGSCSHLKMMMKFDDHENLDKAIIVNKCIGRAYEVTHEEIDEHISKIEECHWNPGEKIIGQGNKKKEDDHLKKMIGMKNIEEKNCSIISILLSLFNNHAFKLGMEEFYVNENRSLCRVGSCQFCLVVNLYIRYVNSKRTIIPEEILGLTASRKTDQTSIDVIYKNLSGSL